MKTLQDWQKKIVFTAITILLLSLVTTLLGGLYESYLMQYYADYKIKDAEKRLQACVYYQDKEINRFQYGLIPDYKYAHRHKTNYYRLDEKTVSMGYSKNAKIDRLQYARLVDGYIYRPQECQNVEYIMIQYFDGVFFRRKIYVYDVLEQGKVNPSPK